MNIQIPNSFNPKLYEYGEEIAYILSVIINRYHFDRRFNYGDAVPIHMKTLRNIIGRENAKPAMDEALHNWLISTNRSYIPGKSSRRYELCPELCEDTLKSYEIQSPQIKKRLTKHKLSRELKSRKNYKQIHYLLEKDLELLEIDELTDENLLYYTKDGSVGQFNSNKDSYHKILNKDWVHSVCENDRFHTNLTNMNKGLRQHIKVGGKRLVFADLNCSQPFFLGVLLKTYIENQNGETVKNYKLDNIKLYTGIPPNHQPPTNPTNPPYDGKIHTELVEFLKQVESGTFYHICANRLGVTKADVKENLIQVLFDKPRSKCKWTEYYKKYFPNLYEIICKLKNNSKDELARYLQQTEAHFVFKVCELIKEEHPELPVYTIHDAIGVPKGSLHIVLNAFRKVFDSHDLTPSLDTGDNMLSTGDLVIVDGRESEIGEILYSDGEQWVVSYPHQNIKVGIDCISFAQSETDRRLKRYYMRQSHNNWRRLNGL